MRTNRAFKWARNIEDARKYLFEKAKKNLECGDSLAKISLIFIILSSVFDFCVFRTDKLLFDFCTESQKISLGFSLLSIGTLLLSWLCFLRFNKFYRKAKEIGNFELIYNVSNRRKIGEIVYEYLPEFVRDADIDISSFYENKYFDSPKELNAYQNISYRMLENCVFNKYLYGEMYRVRKKRLIFFLFIVFILLFYILMFFKSVDCSMLFIYVVGLIVVSSFSFKFLETFFLLRHIVHSMDILIKELLSGRIDTSEKFLYIYGLYSEINLKAPIIKKNLYDKNREKLNKTWRDMKENLSLTNTSFALKEVLPIIKRLLDDNGVKWAITGSASKFLKGQYNYCSDIDILLSDYKDCPKVNELLKPFLVEEICFSESKDIRSYYGKFNIGGINVDVMSEVQNLTKKRGWVSHPHIETHKEHFYGYSYRVTSCRFEKEVDEIINMKDYGK